jgi:hypothetical protein
LANDTTCLSAPDNPIYVFPEMKMRGLAPSSYIRVSVSDFLYSQDRYAYLATEK